MANFNGSEGAPIELAQAASWTRNYRSKAVAGAEGVVVKAHFFGRDILQQILDQPGCMGIRMYYARDEKGQKQLILIGADANGKDMQEGTVADGSVVCPPDCTPAGELNG
ncbi:hypothetical protein [Pontibacter ruber]|uniref:Uncharacterized protein n=1 Tax=Pontibacter ruber TaxID=1343895 RepID=A0ABW5CXB6_9BACT|nr:hypothetical protein [Pontibacter ruber]